MRMERISYDQLNFLDSLVLDYLEEAEKLRPFVHQFPGQEGFEKIIDSVKSRQYERATLVDVLSSQNAHLPLSESSRENISRLLRPETFTVTTGHQLCLFTGPLYFPFKIISTIVLSQKLKVMFPASDFVPVYWLASEDHDAAEINHAFVAERKITWPVSQGRPVGKLPMTGIDECISQLADSLKGLPFAELTIDLVKQCYLNATDLADATRQIVNSLFGKYGVVVLDADHPDLKKQLRPILGNEIENMSAGKLVTNTTEMLGKEGFTTSLHVRAFNFFIFDNGLRIRIEKKNDSWVSADGSREFTESELHEKARFQPEFFSPNVILRPLYQEKILPNIAYVGGPGEIAYWLVLKAMFDYFKVNFPALVLRDCAMIIGEKIEKKISDTGLSPRSFFQDKQLLIQEIMREHSPDLDDEKKQMLGIFETVIEKAGEADRTLEGAARAELQKQLQGLENLEKKMLRSARQKEQHRITRIETIFEKLFPDNELQERHDNILGYLAEYPDLIDQLVKVFDPLEKTFRMIYPGDSKY